MSETLQSNDINYSDDNVFSEEPIEVDEDDEDNWDFDTRSEDKKIQDWKVYWKKDTSWNDLAGDDPRDVHMFKNNKYKWINQGGVWGVVFDVSFRLPRMTCRSAESDEHIVHYLTTNLTDLQYPVKIVPVFVDNLL